MMNDFKRILGEADDNAFATALSYIISGIIIASGVVMSAIILAVAYVWGWIGLATILGLFFITVISLSCAKDE